MTQISKRPIDKDVESKIYESFYRAIGLLGSEDARLFLGDLLTRTERVMLPKRLAVAILLSRQWSYDSIREALKVTQTTISNIEKVMEHSVGLRVAIGKLVKNESWNIWWHDIEKMFYRLSSPGKVFIGEELIENKLQKKKTL